MIKTKSRRLPIVTHQKPIRRIQRIDQTRVSHCSDFTRNKNCCWFFFVRWGARDCRILENKFQMQSEKCLFSDVPKSVARTTHTEIIIETPKILTFSLSVYATDWSKERKKRLTAECQVLGVCARASAPVLKHKSLKSRFLFEFVCWWLIPIIVIEIESGRDSTTFKVKEKPIQAMCTVCGGTCTHAFH